MKIVISLMVALLFCGVSVAVADDMNEFYVAGTVQEGTWAGFYATSAVSIEQAKSMVIAKCGNTDYCRDSVVGIERGCIAYAESLDALSMVARPTLEIALADAIQRCEQESNGGLDCIMTSVVCADR